MNNTDRGKFKTRHGDSRKPLHNLWMGMKQRCYDANCHCYRHYGGRGITVCVAWLESYESFRDWAIANGYAGGLQIDRINNNGNYDPDNCRFVSQKQNARNRRGNKIVDAFGESKTLADWAEDSRCLVGYSTVLMRLNRGWTAEAAISTAKTPDNVRSGGVPPRLIGEKNPSSILTDNVVRCIRTLANRGHVHRVIASHFGVCKKQISRIISGKAWAHVR